MKFYATTLLFCLLEVLSVQKQLQVKWQEGATVNSKESCIGVQPTLTETVFCFYVQHAGYESEHG